MNALVREEAKGLHEIRPPVRTDSQTMMRLIERAMDMPTFDITRFEQLLAVKERWENQEAKMAFVNDMAEFKKNPPHIYKDKAVNFKTDKGITSYIHASIGEVCGKIVAGLADNGFSHRWVTKRGDGGMMSVTCVITHRLGHSEETTLDAGLDTSGGKNNIQAMASTVSYLERYTLLAATGLATHDTPDDDGHGSEKHIDQPKIRRKLEPKPEPETLATYPEDRFKSNLDSWTSLIEDGKKTAADLIKMAESKGAPLTNEQKTKLTGIKHTRAA